MTGTDALDGFSPATRAWFEGAFAEPTPAQAGAWRAIGKGEDTLVVAPTGSGKTLAAFLWAIDKLGQVSNLRPISNRPADAVRAVAPQVNSIGLVPSQLYFPPSSGEVVAIQVH